MSGILHIFRTHPDAYQVNYTLGPRSWVRVMTREQLEEVLVTPAAFDDILIAKVFDELGAKDNVTVADVVISENEATVLGFEPMPSDA
jgi:hypothetical protein